MVAARDLKCGNDVAKMAALGRYAEEFIVYAVSYQQDGKVWHRVSSNQDEIWRFVQESQQSGLYPTIVQEWVNRTLVPSGERDHYLLETKISMAQKMKKQYPPEFMAQLNQFAQQANNNAAYALLKEEQDALLGCFEREKLERFRLLVQTAYAAKKLSATAYQELQGWLEHILKQMEDDVVLKKSFCRTFYGFGYQVQSKKKYYANASQALVWQKRQQLMQQGHLATPLWHKTYWYDYQPDLLGVRQEFLAYIEQWFDDIYWQQLETIQAQDSAVSSQAYQAWLAALPRTQPGQLATAQYYQTCWGL